MALFHLSVTQTKRSAGQSAIASAAYRAGERLYSCLLYTSGKTTFALRLAAACTTGGTLPGMKPLPPFQVIYQTAEDGLGDTVKPRLIEAEADLDLSLLHI